MNPTDLHENTIDSRQFAQYKNFWLRQLAGRLPDTRFPEDRLAPDQPADYRDQRFQLDGALAEQVLKLGNGSDKRLHMILTAALATLLSRYTNQRDVLLGTPIYKQQLDGDFINKVLPLRFDIDDSRSFKELLLQTRDRLSEAVKHQNYPLDLLTGQLDSQAVEQGRELLDVMTYLANIQDPSYVAHLSPSVIWEFHSDGDAVTGLVKYRAAAYDETTIRRFIRHFLLLLQRLLEDVNLPTGDVDIVSGAERTQLLEEFNGPYNRQANDKTLVSLFEAQVEKTPDAPAIVGSCDLENGIETLTYRELNRRANRVAHNLIERGAGPGTIVCIVMKPSLDMAVGLWAILKTGACYLPVDPGYPSDSLDYLMRESCAAIILTHEGMECSANEENPAVKCRPEDAAYIIFTSGTTGRPKGVVVEHRNIVNTLAARSDIYRLERESVSLQLLSFMFDAFVISFFTPLTGGGSVVLLKEEEIRDIRLVCWTIAARKVTHLVCVPTLYNVLIQHLSPEEAACVRMVTLGGDRLSSKLLAATREKNGDIEVVNEYGITEAAVTTTLQRHQEQTEQIRVGSPIANTMVYVLDSRLRLQPLGVPGELCVGGKGISRGYLNNPALTAERFVANPFVPGEIMYRSGDWARWSADGSLGLLGRMDEQVKIRGYRIELQEIENALQSHPAVREAVVTAHETVRGDRLLAAFIVPLEAGACQPVELEGFLHQRLPDYMVPRHFQELGELPLTANGKVDRRQLTKVALTLQPHNEYVAPRTPVERKLADIWAGVLEVEKIGIHDHFFNSGGDSIRSISLLSLINQEFQTQFKIVELYEADTIETFAKKLDAQPEHTASGADSRIQDQVADLKDRFLNQL